MAKQSFLIVSLKESKAKKLAQVLTNDTSLKILDFLAGKDATETELANRMGIPISTIHYNLKILVDAKMVKADKFHYSDKGKVVNHYSLANKYILIAPEKDEGLKERLSTLLPVSAVLLVAAGAVQIFSSQSAVSSLSCFAKNAQPELLATAVADESGAAVRATVPTAAQGIVSSSSASPLALWFLAGALAALVLYMVLKAIRER